MSAVKKYSVLIDSIFGPGTTAFDTKKNTTHNVIGALNHPDQFEEFKTNFIARLQRLKQIYSSHPTYLRDIIVKVNKVAHGNGWEGAFAELAAYDHFNQDILKHKNHLYTPIKPDVFLDKAQTFALELNNPKQTNLDGFVEEYSLYFDVKTLKDNVGEILRSIYEELQRHYGRTDLNLLPEYATEMSHEVFANGRRDELIKELKSSIVPDITTYVKSSVIPGLSFRLGWSRSGVSATSTRNTDKHAENFHQSIFKSNYISKFVKDYPTVIVLVIFPWYNLIINEFAGMNKRMYRAVSRRVFCQYRNDKTKLKEINPKFSGEQTIYEVSNYLSGIIFLEDYTITSKEPESTNVKSYVYLNPNAVNPLRRSLAKEFITGLHNAEYDDFEDDNY